MRPRTSSHHTLKGRYKMSRSHSSTLIFLVAAICAHMLALQFIGSDASAQINCSASPPAACANPLKLLPLPTPRCRFPKAQKSGQAPVAPHHLYSSHMCYPPLPSNTYLASKKNQAKKKGNPWTALVPNRKDRERSRGPTLALFLLCHLPRPRSRSGMTMKFEPSSVFRLVSESSINDLRPDRI